MDKGEENKDSVEIQRFYKDLIKSLEFHFQCVKIKKSNVNTGKIYCCMEVVDFSVKLYRQTRWNIYHAEKKQATEQT